MPYTEFHGNQYVFGFTSSNAPTITNFAARKASLSYEPEIFVTATDGEGLTEAVARTKSTSNKITGTFSGYIAAGFSGSDIGTWFSWTPPGNSGPRHFIVKNVTVPYEKGSYAEVTLEVESYALVTAKNSQV